MQPTKLVKAILLINLTICYQSIAFSQTSPSPIPYGGKNSEAFPPVQWVRPIPPDPPSAADQNEERLPNGYTKQQMEWLKADPHIKVFPNGTFQHLPPSRDEIRQAIRNNPDVPQPPPGWNSREASDPRADSTPGPPSGVPGPHPIQPSY